jgi:hypothetical protein
MKYLYYKCTSSQRVRFKEYYVLTILMMFTGCVGDWANHLTDDMNRQMNQMIGYKLRNSDITFAFKGTHFESNDGDTIEQTIK